MQGATSLYSSCDVILSRRTGGRGLARPGARLARLRAILSISLPEQTLAGKERGDQALDRAERAHGSFPHLPLRLPSQKCKNAW